MDVIVRFRYHRPTLDKITEILTEAGFEGNTEVGPNQTEWLYWSRPGDNTYSRPRLILAVETPILKDKSEGDEEEFYPDETCFLIPTAWEEKKVVTRYERRCLETEDVARKQEEPF
jgi:hypothetical protein